MPRSLLALLLLLATCVGSLHGPSRASASAGRVAYSPPAPGAGRAPALRAAPIAATFSAPTGVVRAGDVIELTWRLADGSVEELELELSVDGGPWRRVSPELPGLTRRFAWQVPAIAAERARLRLRVGTERAEYDLEPSAPFAIAMDPAPVRPLAPDAEFDAPARSTFRDTAPSLSARATGEPADAPTRPALLEPRPMRLASAPAALVPTPVAPTGPALRRPRFVPLRN